MDILKKENGAALPLALMVMVVLAILGTTLWHFSMNDVLQVERDQNRTQAYYLAASSADAMGQYLVQNPEGKDVFSLVEILDSAGKSDAINVITDYLGEAGILDVEVNKAVITTDDDLDINIVEITGTGYVDGVMQSVSVVLEELGIGDIFDAAIKSNNDLLLSGMGDIEDGSLVSKGIIEVPNDFDNDPNRLFPNSDFHMPPKIFPEESDSTSFESKLKVDNQNSPYTIESNRVISEIEVMPNRTLEFQGSTTESLVIETNIIDHKGDLIFHTVEDYPIVLIVNDELDFKGDITIDGFGVVELYIRNLGTFQTPKDILVKENADFLVYLDEGSEATIIGNSDFYGHIYGPQATVSIQNQHAGIRGSVVVNQFNGQANADIYYQPLRNPENIDLDLGYKVAVWQR